MIRPDKELTKFCALVAIGWPALDAISWPVTCERNAKAPAPVLIFFQLDWIDLLTRFFGLRRLRLVTVLVLVARLLLRLANEYYNNNMNLCVQKKIIGYSSLVRPALEVIFKIPIVINPAIAVIPNNIISDSIKINHNMDTLYPFSFD